MKSISVDNISVPEGASIQQALECLDKHGHGIVLIINQQEQLVGTITDGDIRRAILSKTNLLEPVSTLLERKKGSLYPEPIVAHLDSNREDIAGLMVRHSIRQIPIVDDRGRVANLVTIDEFLQPRSLPIQAVVMAGGFGTRLRPLTDDLPKPMLPVGGKPILEHIIDQIQKAGIQDVKITTYYQAEKITQHFGDGQKFGLQIDYVNEERPLGTAGAIRLIDPKPDQPLLIINGDILTQIDFRAMLKFHQKHQADMTVAVKHYELQVPYGVLQCEGPIIQDVQEKPAYDFLVNAGIYLLEPSMLACIPGETRYDMTDLITKLLSDKRTVVSFPIVEYWLDIGQLAEYEQAQKDAETKQTL